MRPDTGAGGTCSLPLKTTSTISNVPAASSRRPLHVNNEDDFLGGRMDMPRGSGARRNFQNVDHGLLNLLALALQIGFQDLRQLGTRLRKLRKDHPRGDRQNDGSACEIQELPTNELH